ncbi:MAG: hypothetical protein SGILL_004929 [Bacillariaceae sp.]
MSSSVASGASTSSTSSSSLLRSLNPLASKKAKKEIEKRRGDVKTYTVPVMFGGDLDRKAFYQQYHKRFNNNANKTAIYRLQTLRKYPSTVGKFYHELVEHSGRLSPEEFWQRYEYRCRDINRVLGELQAAKEANKKLKKQQQQKLRGTQSMKAPMTEKTASLSWMDIRGKSTSALKASKKSKKASFIAAIETAGTTDTADSREDAAAVAGTNHIEAFKRSICGDGNLSEASPSATVQTLSEDESVDKTTGVTSIFRSKNNTPANGAIDGQAKDNRVQEENASVTKVTPVESTPPLKLVGIWLMFAVLASVALEPHRWMTQQCGNKLCAPVRPGSMLDSLSGGASTFTAPWWAPAPVKDSVFGWLCALDAEGNARKRIQISAEVHQNRLVRRDDHHLALTVADDVEERAMFRVRRVKSFGVDSTGSVLMVEHFKGSKEYDAPWALP